MFDLKQRVSLGKTTVSVPIMAFGTGNYGAFYKKDADEEAIETIRKAHQMGIRFFDTAALYGKGYAEQMLGNVLPELDRESLTIATKVGFEVPETPRKEELDREWIRDYSYDGVMRSFENSLKRLKLDKVDILHIHGPSAFPEEAYRAVSDLRAQGVIKVIGAGAQNSVALTHVAQEGEFDCMLLAGRYTLLDQSAMANLMPLAEQKGISILIGGTLNSGILADPYNRPTYDYAPAEEKWIEKAKKLDSVCRRYDVPLIAAALQFPLAHPAVASIVIGAMSATELMENVQMLQLPIPKDLWQEFKHEGLLPEEVPTPSL